MKAFLINPDNATITEVDYNGDWRTIKDWLGGPPCNTFTLVQLNAFGDGVYVDDEGLINDNPHGWFTLTTYRQPLKGLGLVLGCDQTGESTEPYMSLDTLKSQVHFPKDVNRNLLDTTITVRPL